MYLKKGARGYHFAYAFLRGTCPPRGAIFMNGLDTFMSNKLKA